MIQPNELRIGNFVDYEKTTHKIIEIGLDKVAHQWWKDDNDEYESTYYDLEGIPLTPEILEKCGFVKEVKKSGSITSPDFGVYTLEPLVYNTNHGWWLYRNNIQDSPSAPKHLHQLQNLYFALTGTELNYQPH